MNPSEPTKIVLSDGVERVLRYSLGSMKRILRHAGGADKANVLDRLELVTFQLHEGLRGAGDPITSEQLDEIIDVRELDAIDAIVTEAMKRHNSPAKNGEPVAAIPAATDESTSITSGQLVATISGSQTPNSGN